jgi:hypothetical protein
MGDRIKKKEINGFPGEEISFESVDACILKTTVSGNGYHGGDSGHGARTKVKFENIGGFVFGDIKTTEDSIEFAVEGDGEAVCLIHALRRAANEIERIMQNYREN